MNPAESHRRAMQLFDAVYDLPEGEQMAFLEERCADDDALRREVESLMRHDALEDELASAVERGGDWTPSDLIDVLASVDSVPEQIGAYRIVREIGHGGMGVIYEAEQDAPRRRVAVKVLRTAMITPALLRRFEREAHFLGRLQHPGIAHVHEAGVADFNGTRLPFIAMEYVPGRPITEHARDLSINDRLELMARVSDAVHHAHTKHVVHRDLKPNNILVLESSQSSSTDGSGHDHVGQPKVLDFGVARLTGAESAGATVHTETGQIIGTIAYMSPEQIGGASETIDARSDIYALGVVLHQLLTGRLPIETHGLSIADAARRVQEDDPARAGTLDRRLRGDAETIIGTMLEKDPVRRYSTAADVAADLRRAIHDEPIDARAPSAIYQIQKFARRHRGLVAGLGLTLLAIVGGLIGITFALLEAQSQRDEAMAARQEVGHVAEFQTRMLGDTNLAQLGIEIAGRLRSELTAARVGSAEGAALDPKVAATFEDYLDDINMTNVARATFKNRILDRSTAELDASPPERPNTHARMRATVARAYLDFGLPEDALVQIDHALALHHSETADDAVARLDLLATRANALVLVGRIREAIPVAAEVADGFINQSGPDDARARSAAAHHARTLYQAGELDEALERFDALLKQVRRLTGPASIETIKLVIDRARVLRDRDQYEAAATELRAITDVGIEHHGRDNAVVLSALSDLGTVLYSSQQYEDAEALMREYLDAMSRTLGDDSLATLGARNDLGMLLLKVNRLEEAEPLLRAALDTRRRIQPDSSETVASAVNYCGVLFKLGRQDEALQQMLTTAAAARRTLGMSHPTTLTTFVNSGALLLARGRFEEAIPYLREGTKWYRRLHPPTHHLVMAASVQYVQALIRAKRFEEASPVAAQLYEDTRAADEGRRARLEAALAHARLLYETGDFEAAAAIAEATYDEAVRVHGAAHRAARPCVAVLVELYRTWHDADPHGGHARVADTWESRLIP